MVRYRARRKRRKFSSSGVPAGYREDWAYHGHWGERKLRKGLWKFNFNATKRRRANSYGNFGKGTKGAWRINGIQYIEKTGKGKYQTRFVGYKRPLRFYVKNPKKRYNSKRKW